MERIEKAKKRESPYNLKPIFEQLPIDKPTSLYFLTRLGDQYPSLNKHLTYHVDHFFTTHVQPNTYFLKTN